MEHEYRINAETELNGVIAAVLDELGQRENDGGAIVLALHGDLGAGKTTFTQHLARTLGVTDTVTSPTFVVMKQYECDHDLLEHLIHIDAYRIEDEDEMRPLGFAQLLEQPNTLIVIEWAERIAPLLPADTLHLTFAIDGEARIITTNA